MVSQPAQHGAWVNFDEWTDPVQHLEDAYQVTGPLAVVLTAAFADTQLRVSSPEHPHTPETYMPTGRLAASGASSTSFDGSVWEGTITYDAARDTKDGGHVYYAIYEMNRGGIHDFFSELPAFDEAYMQVIHEFFASA